jgi:hypothetical protein
MNYQETINKIKALFEIGMPVAPANPDVSGLTDYILQDGTKVSINKLEVGGLVTINGTPAPDGEHKVQDGTIVKTKEGVIQEITSPAEEVEGGNVNSDLGKDMEEKTISTDMGKKMEDMAVEMAEVKTKCASYESKMAETEAEMKKQKEAITMLTQMIEKMATMPVEKPAAMATNQFTAQKSEDKEERFQQMVEAMKKLKTN